MKPAFALNITDNRISLLHRTSRGWLEVGGVELDSSEVSTTLSYLRTTAQALDPRGLTSKVVIPNSQILYLTLPAPGPDAASRRTQIRAQLEGRTPYPVEDLVFDWWGKGATVQVAVVARETLDEAEAFAVSNKLNPMSFVAVPPAGQFQGEPWFGPTAFAPTLLGPGEKVERDQDPIHIVGRTPTEETAAAPPDEAETETDIIADLDPEMVVPEESGGPITLPEAALAAPEPPQPAAEVPPVAEFVATPPVEDIAPEAPFAEVEDDFEPPVAITAPEIVEPPDDEPLTADPIPVLADTDPKAMKRAAAAAVRNSRAAAKAEPARKAPPARAPVLGPATRAPDRPAIRPAAEALSPLEQVTASVKAARAEGKAKPTGPMVTAPTIPVPKERRTAPIPDPVPAPPQRSRAQERSAKAEAQSMTVFGARQSGRGKPKYLGLILTAILLIFLAAVAAWSSMYVAAWINPDAPKVETAAVQPADATGDAAAVDPTAAVDPNATADGTDTADEVPTAEDEALADGQDIDPADDPDAAAVSAEDSQAATDDTSTNPDDQAITSADATQPTTADEAQADGQATAEAPAAAEPEAAPPAPATTETASRNPGDEPQDEIFLSTAQPAPETADAIALASPQTSADAAPAAQPDPPPFGTTYQFDAQGRIIPTKEGIITPEGVRLVAGPPPVIPPERPAKVAAAAAPAAAPAQADALSDVPADAGSIAAPVLLPNPAFAGFRPKLRPENAAPPQTAGQDDGAALSDQPPTRVASLKPRPRPAERFAANNAAIAAEKTAAAEAATASLVTASLDANTGGSKLAVEVSRKPAPRPLVTDKSIETAVAEANAVAVSLPEPQLQAGPTLALATPDPEPQVQPAVKTTTKIAKAAKPAKTAPADADDTAAVEAEADVKDVTPSVPTKANVAKNATFANAINLSKTNLIGVYGTPANRYALVRQSTGRFVKVEVGDRLDGGRVAAISQSELRYIKNGQTLTLSMPSG